MKILLIINLAIPLLCFQPRYVKIMEATSRVFSMGREESGAGVEYKIRIKVYKGSEQLSFTRVWIGSKGFVPEIRNVSGTGKKYHFQKGDELMIRLVDWTHRPQGLPEPVQMEDKSPPDYKGAGLIIYQAGRKEKSTLIPVFRKLPEEIGL